MKRQEIQDIYKTHVLPEAARRFGVPEDAFVMYPDYEGAANLVFDYQLGGVAMILRASYTPERNAALIQAELDFVNYLADHGVRVSRPVPSTNEKLVETVNAEGIPFYLVTFVKGPGMRVPDNGYRYRTDAPIEEYFQNWGQVLGQMHALSKQYQPAHPAPGRPDWFSLHKSRLSITNTLPPRLSLVQKRILTILSKIQSLPKDHDSYGLIHGDFNDGNFTVDYTNGDITVFDFDDSCTFWYVYELAAAWEGGIGRAMFRSLGERRDFMAAYMDQVMTGYSRENQLSDSWLARLPLFIQLLQVEEFLHYANDLDSPDDELHAHLDYKIKCIEEEIPFMGFFDSLYSPQHPFALE